MSTNKIFYFDVETTGLKAGYHEMVQLAYLIEVDGNVEVENSIWIRPEKPDLIKPELLELLGKTKADLMEGIHYSEAYITLLADLEKHCSKFDRIDKFYPAGYNVSFDLDFLVAFFRLNEDQYLGSWINWKSLDPLPILRFLDYKGKLDLPDYKLGTVCEHYGIELNAHEAMSDIRATRTLLKKFLKEGG